MAAALARARLEAAMNSLPPKVQKFINTHIRKGENFELKTELNSEYRERRKEAVKRVIANMTVGKDVSGLFADVLKCMQTDDLELKKLVYLYLMNYAKSQPELVILAVNSFVKDAEDPNPLIRALAVRTMGCLRAERIVDYLTDPLRKTLKDRDPYVRKTAAICVAKLYDLKPVLTVENGFISLLQDLLSDQNPMVVANTVAALREISNHALDQHAEIVNMRINGVILQKLLMALNESTEWGQIFILESLSEYTPADSNEAFSIIERVTPRLAHANGAVVLAAVRVLLLYLPTVLKGLSNVAASVSAGVHGNAEDATNNATASLAIALAPLLRKLGPPLVSLLSLSHEIAYVALRNINIVLQQRELLEYASISGNPLLLSEMRMFFCKYNDPPCVKMEKLDVLLKLATKENANDILQELSEYAKEVDITFARKAIRSLASCATIIPDAARSGAQILASLLQNQGDVTHVVNETLISSTILLRRYPNIGLQDHLLPLIAGCVETVDEEEARCALLWAIGFHADQIKNAEELLAGLVENFREEHATVQLQMLTSVLYCDLHRRNMGHNDGPSAALLQNLLQVAMRSDAPDLRDRAVLYWRLLTLPAASTSNALATVLGTLPPPITAVGQNSLPESVATSLMSNIGTLASLRHELPTAEVYPGSYMSAAAAAAAATAAAGGSGGPGSGSGYEDEEDDIGGVGMSGTGAGRGGAKTSAGGASRTGASLRQQQLQQSNPSTVLSPQRAVINLLDLDFDVTESAGSNKAGKSGYNGGAVTPELVVVLARTAGNGLEIKAGFHANSTGVAGSNGNSPGSGKSASSASGATGGPGALGKSEEAATNVTNMITFEFVNHTSPPVTISDFAIQFNKNVLGVYPSHGIAELLGSLVPGVAVTVPVKLARNEAMVLPINPPNTLQIAVKSSLGIFYFGASFPLSWLQPQASNEKNQQGQPQTHSQGAQSLIDDLLK